MRLINTSTFDICEGELKDFTDDGYAVLSHRWMANEVNFQDFPRHIAELRNEKDEDRPLQRVELSKIRGACRIARLENIKWMWIDTCCINKTSTAEVAESINAMFRWYEHAKICITYLQDVRLDPDVLHKAVCGGCESPIRGVRYKCLGCPDWDYCSKCVQNADSAHPSHRFALIPHSGGLDVFHSTESVEGHPQPSVWFRRGWTLQELLAPKNLKFYDTDWNFLGTKEGLAPTLQTITGIKATYLTGSDDFKTASVAAKMSWMARRETSRPEDIAYSMLGLLGINLIPIYGEGAEEAFMRLQYALLRKSADESLFAWKMPVDGPVNPSQGRKVYSGLPIGDYEWGLLAPSPKWFQDCGSIIIDDQRFIARDHGGFVENQQGVMGPLSFGARSEKREDMERLAFLPAWLSVVGVIPWVTYKLIRHQLREEKPRKFPLNAWEKDTDGRLKVVVIYLGKCGDVGWVRVRSPEYRLAEDSPGRKQEQVQFLRPDIK